MVTGAEFAANLQIERAAAKALAEILQAEQDALIEGRIERLEALAPDKAHRVRQLAELAAQRNRSLAARSLSPDIKGMQAWLAEDDAGAKAASAWRDLLQLAQTAQQLNRTNGEIIALRLKHNQQALAALQSAAGATSLYGPHGQTLGFSRGRALGQV